MIKKNEMLDNSLVILITSIVFVINITNEFSSVFFLFITILFIFIYLYVFLLFVFLIN